MATDYFGYSRTSYGPGNIASSNAVLLAIDSEDVRLCQSVEVQYQRTITPAYELGSESVWFVAGRVTGSCRVNRSVGEVKLLDPYKPGSACETQTLTIAKGDGTCFMDAGTLTMANCLLESVGISVNTQDVTITDNAQWQIGTLTVGSGGGGSIQVATSTGTVTT